MPYELSRKLSGDRCFCRTCGEYFNSSAAFDKHRIGTLDPKASHYGRRCRTVEQMQAAGMELSKAGWWLRDARWAYESSALAEKLTTSYVR
jgi:hypothetical protein